MRIKLTTSTLRSIYNLQHKGMDDQTIISALYVKQRVDAAKRALDKANHHAEVFVIDNQIDGEAMLEIVNIAEA